MPDQPPKITEFQSLNCWPLAAFAARCARRIFPLYRSLNETGPGNVRSPEHIAAVERAINLAEGRARLGSTEADSVYTALITAYELEALRSTLQIIQQAAIKTESDAGGGALDDPFWTEATAYACAATATNAAFLAAFRDEIDDASASSNASLGEQAYRAAVQASSIAREHLLKAAHRDFKIAESLTAAKPLSAGVSAQDFGPLWPDGRPAGWPQDAPPRFRPRARLMLLLGEQLIRDAGLAVFELVKNAYDADATYCKVTLKDIDQVSESAEVAIEDDGCGMDVETVLNTWLEPGTDLRKQQREQGYRTPRFNRIPLGEKGVGRFAVHKLGRKTTMVTRKAGHDEAVVSINWPDFEKAGYLNDVPIHVTTRSPEVFIGDRTGTRITVTDLQERPWTRARVRSLYRAITSICSPFKGPSNFIPDLTLKGGNTKDWLKNLLVAKDVIEQAPFKFTASIDRSGLIYDYVFQPGPALNRVDARTVENRVMTLMSESQDGEKNIITVDPDTIGTIFLEFYIFDRTPEIFRLTTTDPRGMKSYLDNNGGVRVYRDGIRVFDYGEPGNDWLNLGGRRINDPTERIGNNQIIGAVRLGQDIPQNAGLVEKTNREGFVDNDSFRAFHSGIVFAIRQAELERNIDKRRIRVAYAPSKKKELVMGDLAELREELGKHNLEQELGPIVDRIESQYRQVTERFLVAAGAGLNLSVVFHEVDRSIGNLKDALERGEGKESILLQARQLSEMVDGLTWITRKSALSEMKISALVSHAISSWKFRYRHHQVHIENGLTAGTPDFSVKGYRRLLLMCLMNLIDNSIYWLSSRAAERKIFFGTVAEPNGKPCLIVADNGPGFIDAAEFLIEPFFTRRPEGMGLGLHIADEIMQQHNGKLLFPDKADVPLPPEFTGAVVAMQFPAIS